LSRLGNAGGDLGDDHVDRDGEEGSKNSGKAVLDTTVLGDADHLLDEPTNNIHPRHGSRERETCNDGVKGLSLELLGDQIDGLDGLGGHVRHSVYIPYH